MLRNQRPLSICRARLWRAGSGNLGKGNLVRKMILMLGVGMYCFLAKEVAQTTWARDNLLIR